MPYDVIVIGRFTVPAEVDGRSRLPVYSWPPASRIASPGNYGWLLAWSRVFPASCPPLDRTIAETEWLPSASPVTVWYVWTW